LERVGTEALCTTTLHLEQQLGSEYMQRFGGLHKFMSFKGPILTDSGGFQVFSLINRQKADTKNVISDAGCSFTNPLEGSYNFLSPEISQVIQHRLGSDFRVVLDEPVIEDGSLAHIKESVKRTTLWAKRSKKAFIDLLGISEAEFNDPTLPRPLLTAVIQGGNNFKMREESAKQLVEIGFDIYGFGGVPVHDKHSWKNDAPTGFYQELIEFVAGLIPADKIRYGLGIGNPDNLAFAVAKGWDIFDCVLPTRNARHSFLYVHKGQGDAACKTYDVLHIKTDKYKFSDEPVDAECDCETCQQISRAYLRFLLRTKNPTGYRYATIHNLRFFNQFMLNLKTQANEAKI
jgi:queuine tRNA-ribosyltransferase